MPLKKYFIAIVIPEPLFSEIEQVKHTLLEEHGLKGALRSPAHITLHRPFEWKEEKESELLEKLKCFRFEKDFRIELKDFASFAPRVIYANVKPQPLLFDLHTELKKFAKKELRLFNEDEDKRGFHPHVTVAFRDLKKPKFYYLEEKFKSKKLEGSFNYQGFCLLKLSKKWEILERFPGY
jgi:2'-5' RNA ligase